jgi:hypothetical protein
MNGGSESDFTHSMKKYGRMYTYAGYGGRFRVRLSSMDTKPYNSLAMVQPSEYPLVLG